MNPTEPSSLRARKVQEGKQACRVGCTVAPVLCPSCIYYDLHFHHCHEARWLGPWRMRPTWKRGARGAQPGSLTCHLLADH